MADPMVRIGDIELPYVKRTAAWSSTGQDEFILRVSAEDAHLLPDVTVQSVKAQLGAEPLDVLVLQVVGATGAEEVAYGFRHAKEVASRLLVDEVLRSIQDQLNALKTRLDEYKRRDYSIVCAQRLYNSASRAIFKDDSSEARRYVIELKGELNRLEQDPANVLLRDVLSGELSLDALRDNDQVRSDLDRLIIRGAGFQLVSRETLDELSADALKGVTSVQEATAQYASMFFCEEDQVEGLALGVTVQDLRESDSLAPVELILSLPHERSRRVRVDYARNDEESDRPEGQITVPLRLFRDCRDQIARLPHGIVTVLSLTVKGDVVVRGSIDQIDRLVDEYDAVKRRRGGKPR